MVETLEGWSVYEMDSYEIVLPSDSSVIAPTPGRPDVEPTERWLTMTSCHPMYGAAERYVVHARLTDSFTREEGLPPHTLDPPANGGA